MIQSLEKNIYNLQHGKNVRKHILASVISTVMTRKHLQSWLCLLMSGFTPFTVGQSELACPDEPRANWSNLMLHLAELC